MVEGAYAKILRAEANFVCALQPAGACRFIRRIGARRAPSIPRRRWLWWPSQKARMSCGADKRIERQTLQGSRM